METKCKVERARLLLDEIQRAPMLKKGGLLEAFAKLIVEILDDCVSKIETEAA